MKIKYNLEYNFFNIYDEIQGIASSKNSIYRDEHREIMSYTKQGFRFIKYAIIEFIIMIIFNLLPLPNLLTDIINFLFAITVGGTVAYYVVFFSLYNAERNRRHKGELIINEEGILDVSEDGIKLGIPWHYIECVIVTDNIICFITKVMGYISLSIDHYNDVMMSLEKYQDDLKIIDKRRFRMHASEKVLESEDTIIEEKIEESNEVEESEKIEKLEENEELKESAKEEVKSEILKTIKEESTKKTRKKKKDEREQTVEDVEQAIKELTED